MALIERRDSMKFCRAAAADLFKRRARSPWQPWAGSMVNRALTATAIDSRDFFNARRWADKHPDNISTA